MVDDQPPRVHVNARAEETLVCQVSAGETLSFAARGRWRDGMIPAGPEGYRNFIRDMLVVAPLVSNQRWLCLIGVFRANDGGEEVFRIGRGCTRSFTHDGAVYAYANDHPKGYRGNRGSIELSHAKGGIAPVTADEDPASYRGLIGAWARFRQASGRTSGIVLIVGLLIAAAFLLDKLPQGKDLLRSIGDARSTPFGPRAPEFQDEGIGRQRFCFLATLTFLAIQAWFWSRMIIESNYGPDRAQWDPRTVLVWLPRLIGASAIVIGLWGLWELQNWSMLIIGTVTLVVFVIAVAARTRILPRVPERFLIHVRRSWVIGGWLGAIIVMALASSDEAGFGWTLGAPAVVFLAIAFLIPPITTVVQIGSGVRFPTLAAALACAALFSLWTDNHVVGSRHWAAASGPYAVPQRISLADAYCQWHDHQIAIKSAGSTMVLVASEGGASRAGYWTAEVLSALHDRSHGKLADDLFAINSVSGGSVGAVGYGASLRSFPGEPSDRLRSQLAGFAGRDALSPVLTGLLYPDLLQRFLPVGFLPDRAQGLEQAWEHGWDKACGSTAQCLGLMQRPFGQLAPRKDGWSPILIVQGTREETGRRILTSPLHLQSGEVDADDFYDVVGHDVAISTAIHNGARFPWVSPAGSLVSDTKLEGHIVDGGYFDVGGTETIREMAVALRKIAAADNCHPAPKSAAPSARPLRIITIFIGFRDQTGSAHPDPQSAPKSAAGVVGEPTRTIDQPKSASFMNDVHAPLSAIWQVRSAQGMHLMRALRMDASTAAEPVSVPTAAAPPPASAARLPYDPYRLSLSPAGDYIPLILTNGYVGKKMVFEPPMDWALSPAARSFMHSAVTCSASSNGATSPYDKRNRALIDYVARRLIGGSPQRCALP